jgi:hypothetical protein
MWSMVAPGKGFRWRYIDEGRCNSLPSSAPAALTSESGHGTCTTSLTCTPQTSQARADAVGPRTVIGRRTVVGVGRPRQADRRCSRRRRRDRAARCSANVEERSVTDAADSCDGTGAQSLGGKERQRRHAHLCLRAAGAPRRTACARPSRFPTRWWCARWTDGCTRWTPPVAMPSGAWSWATRCCPPGASPVRPAPQTLHRHPNLLRRSSSFAHPVTTWLAAERNTTTADAPRRAA